MKEAQKNTVLSLFTRSLEAIVERKRKNPNFMKKIKKLNVKLNIGLEIDKDEYIWFHFILNNGKVETDKGRLEENFDLVIMAVPEDLMFFTNGENSLFHMLFKKNKFGKRKLQIKKGSTGRNLKKLIKIPAILSLDNGKK
ncbi:MAG: hypothetical protein EU548_09140 [Promethearchaeota archaeon]|nr:MAG: hypothetical protein EU548_09140 [Candidatus Lokiarchaeota archaeon]